MRVTYWSHLCQRLLIDQRVAQKPWKKKSELLTKKGQQTYLLHAHDDAS